MQDTSHTLLDVRGYIGVLGRLRANIDQDILRQEYISRITSQVYH